MKSGARKKSRSDSGRSAYRCTAIATRPATPAISNRSTIALIATPGTSTRSTVRMLRRDYAIPAARQSSTARTAFRRPSASSAKATWVWLMGSAGARSAISSSSEKTGKGTASTMRVRIRLERGGLLDCWRSCSFP